MGHRGPPAGEEVRISAFACSASSRRLWNLASALCASFSRASKSCMGDESAQSKVYLWQIMTDISDEPFHQKVSSWVFLYSFHCSVIIVTLQAAAETDNPADEDGSSLSVRPKHSAGADYCSSCHLWLLPPTLLLPSAHWAPLHLPLPSHHPSSYTQTRETHEPGVSPSGIRSIDLAWLLNCQWLD